MTTASQLTTDGTEVPMTTHAEGECPNCYATDPAVFYDGNAYDASDCDAEDAVTCSECYVNDECPDSCNEPHDEPDPDDRGQWECPTTGTTFRYDSYNGWEEDPWSEGSHNVHGDWLIDPWESGWYTCEDCRDWVHSDDAQHTDDGDTYCEDCYPGHAGSADHDRYGVTCHTCRASLARKVVVFDPDTEKVHCEEHAPKLGVRYLEAA